MKKIEKFNVIELSSKEMRKINGGFLQFVALAVAIAGACKWAFEKGEELGKAMA